MSYQLLIQDVLFYQRLLKSEGFYPGKLDGDWGPITSQAEADFMSASQAIAQKYGIFDSRSEGNMMTLNTKAQVEARKFMSIAINNGINARIISGTRTYAQQNALYRQGRYGNPGPIVTNATGGKSNHNFGIAWDIGLFESSGAYITRTQPYIDAAQIILPHLDKVEWGGYWTSFKDYPHYQLKAISTSVAVIHRLFEEGKAYV